jgi:hypothetical protein
MGANGSDASGMLEFEQFREYITEYSIGDNIKVLSRKQKGQKLPEESHTPGRIYATFYKDGHDLKSVAAYGPDHKKLYEIHTIAHHNLGAHFHYWKDGRPVDEEPHQLTPDMKKLIFNIRHFKDY